MTVIDRPPAPAQPDFISYIPSDAPFDEDQRAWLNGFLAGYLSVLPAAAPDAAGSAPRAEADDDEAPWHDPTITLAERMEMAKDRPLPRRMMAAMAQQDCGQCGYTCETYANEISQQAEERLNLCVPGGKETARMLKKLIEEMGGGATDPDEEKAKAEAKAASRLASKSPAMRGYSREMPVEARFLSRTLLNKGASEKSTWHIEFDLAGSGLDYTVGDSFGVYPRNDPALVSAVIEAINAPADFPIAGKTLAEVLTEDMSLGPAPDMLFELISYMVGGERKAKAKALAQGDDPDGDAATLDVLAAVRKFPGIRPDPEAFVECLEGLQPRLYSISSSPKVDPNRLTLTVDHVRYEIEGEGRMRLGVASTFLSSSIAPGTALKVYVQRAHNFALPADSATPIIMVGPGTGVAPFRAFLHERLAMKAPGEAWLFFGHQRRHCDFFYEEEFAGLQSSKALTRLSLAWSRDTNMPKTYVQDRMREEGPELWAWLQRGAHFYVCGDAKRMAADVEKAMVSIAAEHGQMGEPQAKAFVADLKKCGRYQADVY
ncbi:NAD(P)H-dependent nitrite reductase flavoprotein subunit [Enhydrobacter aerosaccus]|uniref:assimilatory sulfite reductase (NADPH) n=1 Tax=Enhydrobacter aerosaccus TaxID=225324 RepID=A0A1T4MRR8_9HYPH|nr:sulfite reductase subunit alpha [Enhydrobacter aerosaccus]SJZ69702.1 NAD(P)H-dependent nitrite reductase flavoprotein subunit [Enhydrobacter aerosaccus]